MALAPRTLDVQLAEGSAGVETKATDLSVRAPQFEHLLNVSLQETGAIKRRRSYEALASIAEPGSVSRLASNGRRLLAFSGLTGDEVGRGVVYSDLADRWSAFQLPRKPASFAVGQEDNSVFQASGDSTIVEGNSDGSRDAQYAATASGIEMIVGWDRELTQDTSTTGHWYWIVRDAATGSFIATGRIVARSVRPAALGQYLVIFAVTASGIDYHRFDTLQTAFAPVITTTAMAAPADSCPVDSPLDVHPDVDNAQFILGFVSTTSGTVPTVALVDDAGAIDVSAASSAPATASHAISVTHTAGHVVMVSSRFDAWYLDRWDRSDLLNPESDTNPVTPDDIVALTVGWAEDDERIAIFLQVEVVASFETYSNVIVFARDGTADVGSDSTIYRAVLKSQAFQVARLPKAVFVCTARPNANERTYIVWRIHTREPAWREPVLSYRHAVGDETYNLGNTLSPVYEPFGDPRWGASVRNRISIAAGAIESVDHRAHTFELYHSRSQSQDVGAVTQFGGNWQYANGRFAMTAFHHPPVILDVANGSAGSAIVGVNSYVAVFEWTDQAGRLIQSIPSIPFTHDYGAGVVSGNITITTPAVSPMVQDFNAAGTGIDERVSVAVYRLPQGAELFRLVGRSLAASLEADSRSAATILFGDATTDADVLAAQALYTDAGILPAFPPPPSPVLALHKNRLWTIGEDGDVYFSREVVNAEGVAWSPVLSVQVEGRTDKPTALASLGNVLVVFFRNGVGLIFGEGPIDTGSGGSFTYERQKGVTVGTINPDSVVQTREGVMFADPARGIFLVPTGGAQPTFVGAAVERFRDRNIVGAHVIDDEREVRFVLDTDGSETDREDAPRWLTYHYGPEGGAWSTGYTGLVEEAGTHISAAAVHLGEHVFAIREAGSDGLVVRQRADSGAGRDVLSNVAFEFTTGWVIPGESFQGLVRLWEVFVLGEWSNWHTLHLQIETRDGRITALGEMDYAVGPAAPEGGYLARAHVRYQESQAYRFRISVTDVAVPFLGGAKFVSIRLDCGVEKRGPLARQNLNA